MQSTFIYNACVIISGDIMTKSIRIDDDVYEKLKAIQDRYDLTLSDILAFLIESKVDMRKLEMKVSAQV